MLLRPRECSKREHQVPATAEPAQLRDADVLHGDARGVQGHVQEEADGYSYRVQCTNYRYFISCVPKKIRRPSL